MPPSAEDPPAGPAGEKGLREALAAEAAVEVGRLAAVVAASLAGGAGMEAAELDLATYKSVPHPNPAVLARGVSTPVNTARRGEI